MKILNLISLIAVSALTLKAHAVTVAECPKQIEMKASGLYVNKSVSAVLKELYVDADDDQGIAAVKSMNNIPKVKTLIRRMDLVKAESGRCRYQERAGADEKAELYTTKGKTLLMLQSPIGPKGTLLRIFATVESVNPRKIQLSQSSQPGLALAIPRGHYESYSAGGALVFVGRAQEFKVTVTRSL